MQAKIRVARLPGVPSYQHQAQMPGNTPAPQPEEDNLSDETLLAQVALQEEDALYEEIDFDEMISGVEEEEPEEEAEVPGEPEERAEPEAELPQLQSSPKEEARPAAEPAPRHPVIAVNSASARQHEPVLKPRRVVVKNGPRPNRVIIQRMSEEDRKVRVPLHDMEELVSALRSAPAPVAPAPVHVQNHEQIRPEPKTVKAAPVQPSPASRPEEEERRIRLLTINARMQQISRMLDYLRSEYELLEKERNGVMRG